LADFGHATAGVTVLRNDPNRGKGFSVARGMQSAHGSYRVFLDARRHASWPASQPDAFHAGKITEILVQRLGEVAV